MFLSSILTWCRISVVQENSVLTTDGGNQVSWHLWHITITYKLQGCNWEREVYASSTRGKARGKETGWDVYTHTHTQSWCILSEKQTQTKQHCILWLAGGSHTSTVTIVTAVPVEKGFGSILEASVWLNGCQEARWMMTCKSPTDRHTSHRGTLKSNTGLVYVCVFGHKCFYSMY